MGAGLYTPDDVATVYEVTLRRAGAFLGKGHSVILDATWRDLQMRAHAQRLATETHSVLVELMCAATVDTAARRIRTRRPGNSDVTPEIAVALATQSDRWDDACRVDTSRGRELAVSCAHDVWRRAV